MCGVVGLTGSKEASTEAFLALTTLQHRGQDAAGILSCDSSGFHHVKNIGLVENVFTRENMAVLSGELALGHARYSTVGRGDISDVQPLVLSYPFGIAMVHNGNIVNVPELAKKLKTKSKRSLLTQSDTEVILNLFADELAKSPAATGERDLEFKDICQAVDSLHRQLNGSYSIVAAIADYGLVAFRDTHGLRPLVLGKRDGAYIVASESVALSFLGYEIVRDLHPGEVIYIDPKGELHSAVLGVNQPSRHCMFEWVYFASPESIIDGVPVYGSRIQLGKQLAKQLKKRIEAGEIKPDLIVPVPETSRIASIALAEDLGIPYREVLIKNRYIKRTFILDSQEKRQKAVNLKLSPVKSEIAGKAVLLVDDSIVRGTTSKKIIELVRRAGASKVYFVSTCPPIQHPCFYGIDFPSSGELIAHGRSPAEIQEYLGADAVIYQELDGLVESVGSHPCTACLTGKYPTDISVTGSQFETQRKKDRRLSSAP